MISLQGLSLCLFLPWARLLAFDVRRSSCSFFPRKTAPSFLPTCSPFHHKSLIRPTSRDPRGWDKLVVSSRELFFLRWCSVCFVLHIWNLNLPIFVASLRVSSAQSFTTRRRQFTRCLGLCWYKFCTNTMKIINNFSYCSDYIFN